MIDMAKGTADADLLRAIEGYSSEHKGSGEHEDMISQLKRVGDQIAGRSAAPGASPGKQAALKAAGRDTMTSEKGEPVGDDNKQSNDPAAPNMPDKVAAIFGKDGRDDRMKDTEAVRSGGITISQLPSSGLAPGTAEARRIVADREKSRPDTKMNLATKAGDDNKQSQPSSPGYPPAKRVGDVGNASIKGGSATEVKGFGTQAKTVSEAPVEPGGVGHDPWTTASAQARKRLVAAHK